MATKIVRDWFKAELQALAASLPPGDVLIAPYIETNNVSPDPAGMPKQWTTLIFEPGAADAISIGVPGCKRELGAADVVIACPAGLQSDAPVLLIAEMIAVRFRERAAKLATNPPTYLRTLMPRPPNTGEDGDGRWFFATVSVPFQCDSYV